MNIDPAQLLADRPAPKVAPQDRKAAENFEAFFLSQMFSYMVQDVGGNTDPMFGGGKSEKIWKSFLTDEYGARFARQGGIGLADKILASVIAAKGS